MAAEDEPTEIDASTEEALSDITGHEEAWTASDIFETGNEAGTEADTLEAGNEAGIEADIFAPDDTPWYEQSFNSRFSDDAGRAEFPEQGCELPRVLRLLLDEDEKGNWKVTPFWHHVNLNS